MAQRANLQAVILAAGKSTRFKTEQSKLTFLICGQEMILYPVKMFKKMEILTTLVVGYQKEHIKDIVSRFDATITFAEQNVQKGTGHAVLTSKQYWNADNILIMNGDCPLITETIMEDLIHKHTVNDATITFVTSHNSDPSLTGYGRVIKDAGVTKIIEQNEFHGDTSLQCCINAGIYLIKRSFLADNLEIIPANRQSGEIYLPELMRMASAQGLHVETVHVPFDYVRGVNTLKELWTVEHIKRSEMIAHWMSQGVRFATAQSVHLDIDVTIGSGTVIGSGVVLLKGTTIGTNCFIDSFSIINNSTIYDNVTVLSHSIVRDSIVHNHAQIGPFAHLRNNSIVGAQSCVGNFVEVTASSIGPNSKAKHLSYIGNAQIGSSVNIGAGSVTCNYNGFVKNTTIIKDNAFIGSNNALIAPVTIGQNAITAAGSTINQDVPDNALAIARARQENKNGYANELRARYHACQLDHASVKITSCDP